MAAGAAWQRRALCHGINGTMVNPALCGLQTAQICVLWITRSGVSCSIVSIRDKSIVWMNWNGGLSMSGADLNSHVLTRLLISGEKDIKRASLLKEDILRTVCEFTILIFSISVTFNVTCLTVASLITKSCQKRWPIHCCSFYKVVHWQIWGMVVQKRPTFTTNVQYTSILPKRQRSDSNGSQSQQLIDIFTF